MSKIYNKSFYDAHKDESLLSAEIIVPLIIKSFECSSVVDVGCGIGTWLSVFKQFGVKEICGVDGNKLAEADYLIDKAKIKTGCDFSSPSFNLNTKADVTICLEVAEHLPESAADIFVEKLVHSAPVIIFSAAYPGQTGVNHINEQPPWYWREKFNKHEYVEIDFLRPLIWKNEKICWWYRQNMTSFVKNDYLRRNPPVFDLFKQYGQRNGPHSLTLVNEWILKKWLHAKSMTSSEIDSHGTNKEFSSPDTNHAEFTPTMCRPNINPLQKTIATDAPAINLSATIPAEKSFPDMDHADKIFTHMTKEEKHKLYELALRSSGKVFVEIGSYLGASSCYIAEAIQSDPSKRLYCVDTWENDGMAEGARDTFDEFCSNTSSYADTIVPLRGKSLEVAQMFNFGIDYLFVDADHSYEAVKADMLAWLPKLNPGAMVICHDTGWAEGIQKAVEEVIAPVSINHDTLPNMYWTHIQSAQNTKATKTSSIHLSVIIPTRNRAQRLSIALESLTMQTYPEHLFEVIVVDNNSSDDTREICRKYEETIKNFQYVYVSEPGLHVARHTGWQRACGEILIYGDDDIRASSTWLEGIAQCFKDPDVALAGGNILPEFEADPPEWLGKLWNKTPWGNVLGPYSLIDFGNHDSEISPMYVWGANFAIKKTVLSEAGGFHPDGMPSKLSRFRGDGETHVSEFIQQHKYKTVHHSRATVFHWISKERMTVEYLYKRMFLQGISDSFTYIRSNKATGKLKQYKNKPDRIEDALYKGHCNGYNYHHIEVKKDPELLKWVLQSTYVADNMTQEDCLYEEDIKQVNNAKKHIQSKDYRAALHILDQISHISQHIKNLQYLRTLCLLNLGRNTEANEAALSELKFFPENSDCINLMNLFSSNDEKNILNANKIKQGAI